MEILGTEPSDGTNMRELEPAAPRYVIWYKMPVENAEIEVCLRNGRLELVGHLISSLSDEIMHALSAQPLPSSSWPHPMILTSKQRLVGIS